MIIKIVLIAALAGAAYLLMHGRPSALNILVRRTLTLAAIGCGVAAVVLPDAVTRLANVLGVGRGADLLLYLACVTFLCTTIGLHLRIAGLRDQYVELARQLAIEKAERRAGERAELPTSQAS